MTHPLTDEMCKILSRQPWLDPDVDVEGTIHDMRAAYDKAVADVIYVMQGQRWADYEGTMYYPDDGVDNVGDAIKKQLYSQAVDLPQADSDVCGEEGAMRAFERTANENYELMRRLADP